MHCVLEGISLLLGAGARAAVRASDSVAGTPRGYISASHVLIRPVSPRCSFSVTASIAVVSAAGLCYCSGLFCLVVREQVIDQIVALEAPSD